MIDGNINDSVNGYYKRDEMGMLSELASKYGPLRNKIALKIRKFFKQYDEYDWFLDNGTLLAAYRDNGNMIPWDDDFDIGVFLPNYQTESDCRKKKLIKELQKFLEGTVYKVRSVKFNKDNPDYDYAEKIEVYDPSHGTKPLRSTNFHHVNLDLQIYTCVDNDIMIGLHASEGHLRCPLSAILPTKLINYEGELYPSPHDSLTYLKSKYGYLGHDSTFNVKTNLYEKRV